MNGEEVYYNDDNVLITGKAACFGEAEYLMENIEAVEISKPGRISGSLLVLVFAGIPLIFLMRLALGAIEEVNVLWLILLPIYAAIAIYGFRLAWRPFRLVLQTDKMKHLAFESRDSKSFERIIAMKVAVFKAKGWNVV